MIWIVDVEFHCIAIVDCSAFDVWICGCLDGPLRVRIIRTHKRNSSLLKQGEILRCASEGNPSPEYTWLDATTGQRLHNGEQLTFDVCRHFNCSAKCAGNNATVTFQCVATVAGQHWTNSDNMTATYSVTCGTYPCGHTMKIRKFKIQNKLHKPYYQLRCIQDCRQTERVLRMRYR